LSIVPQNSSIVSNSLSRFMFLAQSCAPDRFPLCAPTMSRARWLTPCAQDASQCSARRQFYASARGAARRHTSLALPSQTLPRISALHARLPPARTPGTRGEALDASTHARVLALRGRAQGRGVGGAPGAPHRTTGPTCHAGSAALAPAGPPRPPPQHLPAQTPACVTTPPHLGYAHTRESPRTRRGRTPVPPPQTSCPSTLRHAHPGRPCARAPGRRHPTTGAHPRRVRSARGPRRDARACCTTPDARPRGRARNPPRAPPLPSSSLRAQAPGPVTHPWRRHVVTGNSGFGSRMLCHELSHEHDTQDAGFVPNESQV